jgi:hypothetical protein
VLDQGIHSMLKTHIHDAIRLIENEYLQVRHIEAETLVQMLQHASWCANENVHAIDALCLLFQTLSANDETGRVVVVAANLAQNVKDLNGELAGGRDDEGAEAVDVVGPSRVVEFLEDGDQKGEGLAAASLCSSKEVVALEG